MERRGGCALILQQLEVGGVQQFPSPSRHGWWALPVSILAGTCWHSQLELRVTSGGVVIPPCVGVLALFLSIQTTAWDFFLGLLPLQGTTGISWAVMRFGDSHSHLFSKERLHPISVPDAGGHECSGNTKVFQVEKYAS